jgi:hypothetical protein
MKFIRSGFSIATPPLSVFPSAMDVHRIRMMVKYRGGRALQVVRRREAGLSGTDHDEMQSEQRCAHFDGRDG